MGYSEVGYGGIGYNEVGYVGVGYSEVGYGWMSLAFVLLDF